MSDDRRRRIGRTSRYRPRTRTRAAGDAAACNTARGNQPTFRGSHFPLQDQGEQLGGSIGALPGHWRIKMAALAARFRVFAEDRPSSVKRAGEFGADKFGGGWAAIASVSHPHFLR